MEEILFFVVLFTIIICCLIGVCIFIRYANGRYVKVGQVYRLFDDVDFQEESPYNKNYKDYKIVEIKYPFCLAKDIESGKIKEEKVELFSLGGKLKKQML